MNRQLLILLLGLLNPFFYMFSQTGPSLTYNALAEQKLIERINARYTKDVASLNGNNKKYIAEIYKERFELIKDRLKEQEALTDVKTQDYLNALAAEIFRTNAQLKAEDFRILFSRTYMPNATSMGEGTIFFNIGLFHRLQNESQAAFVLCHEIAHYALNHSNNNIVQYVNTVYSEDFQKQLKNISKSEFKRNTQLENLSTNLLFKSRRHSRAFEQSADSMALELMKNTRFNVREALSTLALLDSVDANNTETLDISRTFNFNTFPFKKRWLESDDLIFAISKEEKGKTDIERDSLKTHPDCSLRIKHLSEKVEKYYNPRSTNFVVDEKTFNQLTRLLKYEMIEYGVETNKISRALFLALQTLQAYPEDVYLQASVGKCLNKIYTAQKNHELNKIVDLPGPGFDKPYNDLLQVIQNLRLNEVAAISYFFLQQHEQKSSTDESFVAALIESKQNFNKVEESKQWIRFYQQKFPNGKYHF